jgi:hypothetical protein
MTGELRVIPATVAGAGTAMAEAAANIPLPPAPFVAIIGGDPLSAAAWGQQEAAEAPILEGLPVLRTVAAETAGTIVEAAARYETVDAELGSRLDKSGPAG